MLKKLLIKNIALIDNAEIEFTEGLNVLSGETGSGKSVILESLNFVLGAKAEKSLIRYGSSECEVLAEFDVSDNLSIKDVFSEFDFEYDDILIIQRKFSIDGKGSIKLNGNNVNASMLKHFTSFLVDVHGQSEHFYLLKNTNQLKLLDKFGGDKVNNVKEELNRLYCEYKKILSDLDALGGDESQRLFRLDILNFQIKEIEDAELKENEEDDLLIIKQKLTYQERIVSALSAVKNAIDDEGGVNDILGNALRSLSTISNLGEDYSVINDRLNNVYSECSDICDTASSLLGDFDFNEYDIDSIENRLEKIKQLKKKYGNTYKDIVDFLSKAKDEKNKLENFGEVAEKLLESKTVLEDMIFKLYSDLSDLRRQAGDDFSNKVVAELVELGMSKSKFSIAFNDKPLLSNCKFDSSNGFDEIEFMFSANLGEPLKPMSNVISGGEMSRFMLAIKAQTAKFNDISTFVFDEIDAGISGNVAKIVAHKFANISKSVQLIAITHLPQISSMADNNLLIQKIENSDKTYTTVKTLSAEDKVLEITRLLGGDRDSSFALSHARELIEEANAYKKSI